jgi:hypothetical protein
MHCHEINLLIKKFNFRRNTNMTAEELFEKAGETAGGEKSQMFGKPCYKTGGKAFLCFFKECAVFKLGAPEHAKAMALAGSELFDPSGTGRAMKEWVQVKAVHAKEWNKFAKAAAAYSQPTKKK